MNASEVDRFLFPNDYETHGTHVHTDLTEQEIHELECGSEARLALVNAGLWKASDERDPSQDLNATFEMVTWLEGEFEEALGCYLDLTGTGSTSGFAASFGDPRIKDSNWFETPQNYQGALDLSPAMAIVKAALLFARDDG